MAIKTFVFFDLETTGLPYQERNQTKITELTFLAVSRNDIENANGIALPPMNKLSLLFNPQKHIPGKVANLTGLTNHYLKNQAVFKEKIELINSFLQLPKPVCLVAHNGNRFDYKILLAEYLDAKASLPTDLLCVDSLAGFRHVLKDGNSKKCKNTSTSSCDSNPENPSDWPDLDISLEDWEKIDKLVASFSEMTLPNTGNQKISSYTLPNLYKVLLGKEAVNAHRSEADCLMLLECVLAKKKHFLLWADTKCKLIKDIKPLNRIL